MRAYWILAVVAASSLARSASAQATPAAKTTINVGDFELSPELEVRTRGEYRRSPVDMGGAGTGYYTEDPWAVMERARIGIGADRGALRAKVTLQDARVWGTTPPTAAFAGSSFAATGLYEAFIEIHTTNPTPPQTSTSSTTTSTAETPQYIRVGRQAIVWDGGRLLGNADFSPVARTLDAVRGHVGWKSLDFEAFAAILDEPQPIGIGFGDPNGAYNGGAQLYGALASLTLDPLFRAQVYGLLRPHPGTTNDTFDLASNFSQSRNLGDNWTVALGIGGDSKGWKYGVTGALQLGRVPVAGQTLDRLAFAVVGDASRTLDGILLTPTIKVGGGIASGGCTPGASSCTHYTQFDPLYPDVQVNHGLLGAFAMSNIIDVHGAVSVVPMADFRVTAEYRYARMASTAGDWVDTYLAVINKPGGAAPASEELGHEIDVMIGYRPWPALNVGAGYSLLILGDGAKAMLADQGRTSGGSAPNLSHYAFVQLTLNVPAQR